ncbi:regulatory protein YycH of two-component signal transduction system YycFG [Planococcus citreus]|uniref:Regulatory protein YycH of two-component signal transduction system YycFG n=1 Tax=Planococcus citreus TaxID=1373 RepID=A0A497YP55_9BACL|nr:regulatory protein YycH of two-component signal transduction system YycFG [Planococcus citreus]
MKYLEHVKSIALFILIFLSLALTFTIWTFTPSLEEIETPTQVDVAIGNKRSADEVVRPVKVLYHHEDKVTGTFSQTEIEEMLETIQQWQISDVQIFEEEAGTEVLKQYLQNPGRTVLYYPGAVPFPVFDAIMDITDNNLPESTFNRVVVEWGTEEDPDSVIYFINTGSGRVYEAQVSETELIKFRGDYVQQSEEYDRYITDPRIGNLPVYVPEDPIEKTGFDYLLEETSAAIFADAIMDSPSAEFAGDLQSEEFTDDSGAIMRELDSQKSINYVQPKAETSDPAIPSDLVFNSINFVNEHGGWTDQYVYFGMKSVNQQISYQLFFEGSPVFSNMTAVSLDVEWGIDNGIEQAFRYSRPTYLLDSVAETRTIEMASGEAVLDALARLEMDLSTIEAVTIGYELTESEPLITFQPAWYYKANGKWTRLSDESVGGVKLGLE